MARKQWLWACICFICLYGVSFISTIFSLQFPPLMTAISIFSALSVGWLLFQAIYWKQNTRLLKLLLIGVFLGAFRDAHTLVQALETPDHSTRVFSVSMFALACAIRTWFGMACWHYRQEILSSKSERLDDKAITSQDL